MYIRIYVCNLPAACAFAAASPVIPEDIHTMTPDNQVKLFEGHGVTNMLKQFAKSEDSITCAVAHAQGSDGHGSEYSQHRWEVKLASHIIAKLGLKFTIDDVCARAFSCAPCPSRDGRRCCCAASSATWPRRPTWAS